MIDLNELRAYLPEEHLLPLVAAIVVSAIAIYFGASSLLSPSEAAIKFEVEIPEECRADNEKGGPVALEDVRADWRNGVEAQMRGVSCVEP